MSKKSKKQEAPKAPSFAPSTIMYGDQVVGKTYKDKKTGQIINQYLPSAEEQQQKQLAQSRINSILPTLGITAPEMSQQYDNIANSYINETTSNFDRAYQPFLRNQREDYASRFGGLANTPYIDAMRNNEEQIRQPALLSIANQANLLKKDLYSQQEQQKLNELQALGYNLNSTQQNFLNGLSQPLNASSLANNFNQNNYMQQLQQYNIAGQRQAQSQNALLGFLGGMF